MCKRNQRARGEGNIIGRLAVLVPGALTLVLRGARGLPRNGIKTSSNLLMECLLDKKNKVGNRFSLPIRPLVWA